MELLILNQPKSKPDNDGIVWQTALVEIRHLKEYDKNPRKMDKTAFDNLVKSLKEDGYHQRLLINTDGTIIGGHARKKALLKAGYNKDSSIEVLVPTIPLSEEQFDRVNIRDNLPYGSFDFDMLGNNFDPLKLIEWGMPEDWLDFGKEEIEITDEDNEIPEPPAEPITKLGDVWILGEHRLMCGDSTNPLSVQSLCKSFNPNLMVTDPPYGVNYDAEWRERAGKGIGNNSRGKVLNDDQSDWTGAYSLFAGNVCYVWHADKFSHIIARNLLDCGFQLINQIIWAKQNFAISRGNYHFKHEPCWYAVRKGENHSWVGKRDQSTLWEIKSIFSKNSEEEKVGHGTQKPIECMLIPIQNNSKENEYVYDPFGGSGTTLIACEKSKRKCLMMELDPKYCDVIIARWAKLTGQMAVLDNSGII